MGDSDFGGGRTMDLNLYLGFPSLPQLGSLGESPFASLQGNDSTLPENSEDLPQNAEATLPVPVQSRQWRTRNRRWRHRATNDSNIASASATRSSVFRGIHPEGAGLVLIDPVDHREETDNTVIHLEKCNKSSEAQVGVTEIEEKNPGANFECNICFEFAKEPVVTSCGHLFCWPCLYQWLYIHSSTKECPVCKGLVTDSNITPIYGRGANDSGCERKGDQENSSGLKLPPRPHGIRVESMRQRMRTSSSLNEMPNEGHNENGVDHGQGISRVVRRLRLHNGNFAQIWFPGLHRPVPTRSLRHRSTSTRSSQGQDSRHQSMNTQSSQGQDSDGASGLSSFVRDRVSLWQQIAQNHLQGYDRLSSISASLSNVESIITRLARETSNDSIIGSSTNGSNLEQPSNLETQTNALTNGQVSVDTVVGVVQGSELGENQIELNSTDNSPAHRRLRSVASGSSDVHGGVSHGRKRRRLN